MMFLKFLDDLEADRGAEAKLAGKQFSRPSSRPTAGATGPRKPTGITGDELLAFINHEEATRPDGNKGPGLFAYLRGLASSNGDDRARRHRHRLSRASSTG